MKYIYFIIVSLQLVSKYISPSVKVVKHGTFKCYAARDKIAELILTDRFGCQYGSYWSTWFDRHSPGSGPNHRVPGGEFESLSVLELRRFCAGGRVTAVECRTAGWSPREAGQRARCSVREGLVCRDEDNRPAGCRDYKIRYHCTCPQVTSGRFVRAAPPVSTLPPSCNTWTSWINTHTPNSADPGDHEVFPPARLQTLCPIAQGANITKFQCADQKGEPFTHFISTPDFNVSCEQNLVKCTPVGNRTCADIKAQLYCTCPATLRLKSTPGALTTTATTTSSTVTTVTTSSATVSTTVTPSSSAVTTIATPSSSSVAKTVTPSSSMTTTASPSSSTVSTTVTPSSSTVTAWSVGSRDAQVDSGTPRDDAVHVLGMTISVCALIVVISGLLSLCHCGVTICMYKSLSQQLRARTGRKQASVKPGRVW